MLAILSERFANALTFIHKPYLKGVLFTVHLVQQPRTYVDVFTQPG